MKRRSFDQSDHIRLKLQWLDHRDSSYLSFDRLFAELPMLPLSLAVIAGILMAAYVHSSVVFQITFICLPTAALLFTVGLFKFSPRMKLWLTLVAGIFLFICLGAGRFAIIRYYPPRHIRHILKDDRQLATLRGRIISPIRTNDQNTGFSSIPWLSSQTSFYLSVEAVKSPSGWVDLCGTVRVQVNETISDIEPGNTVQIYCWLSRFSTPANPGQFDLQKYMNARGVYVAASVPVAKGIEILENNHSILHHLRSILYQYSSNALLDETATDPDVYALISALLLGRRSRLNPTITAAFQKTNLAHFISLSGMHVGILAGSLWLLLRTLQIPKRPRAILCIILILTYALIVPPRAPTMRAVFLSCFFFASALLYRRVNPLNTLALSAMVLLLARPYELFTAGWQLSFLSVLGILLFYKTVQQLILDKLFYPLILLFNKRFVWLQHLGYGIIELLAVGISAWIIIAPVLLYYFGRINPLSPLWTVLVFPVILLILYAGFLKIVLAPLLPTFATVLGALLNLLAHLLETMVTILAKVNFVQIVSHRPMPLYILLLYLLLASVFFTPHRFRRLRQIMLLLLVVCFLFPCLSHLNSMKNNRTLEMTCLYVGHGQAAVVSTPTGEHLLFDAGSITHQDIAPKIITPFLQHRRIFALNAVYISHGDLDHLNAIGDIAAAIPIGAVCGNAVFLENTTQPSLEQSLRGRLESLGMSIDPITDYQYGNVQLTTLWPLGNSSDTELSENDRSQVMLLEYASRKILLCGDIEAHAQNRFCQTYPDLDVDVMLLPHHGSTTNLDTQFIEDLSPGIVIASCARRSLSYAYHPKPDSDMQNFYTPIDGAVTVKIKADGTLSATGFLNQKKTK